jgi:hypothetical protein
VAVFLAAGLTALAIAEDAAPGSLILKGLDQKSQTLTAADLQQMTRTELEAPERDGSTAKYAGVEMPQLLEKLGVPKGEALRGEWLRKFLVIEASDGYQVVFALPEFDAAFAERKFLLADRKNGQPLSESDGPLQLIVPSEKRRARWVRMVKSIRLVDSAAAAEKSDAAS